MIVGICDDDNFWCKKAQQVIEDYAVQMKYPVEIICFSSRDALVNYDGGMQVLFLDIELETDQREPERAGDGKGIEVARYVNVKWPNCQIVFLTNYLYYATEVYQTEHVFFVLKEQFEDRVTEIFDKIIGIRQRREKRLVFTAIGGRSIVLSPDEILYFERIKRITVVEAIWGRFEITDRLDELFHRLPEGDFVRCHNSYIVYLPAVRELGKDTFTMKNMEKISISRSYGKHVKQAFLRWAASQVL